MANDYGRRLLTARGQGTLSGGFYPQVSPRSRSLAKLKDPGSGAGGLYWQQMQAELDAAAEARRRDRRASQMALLGAGVGFAVGGTPAGAAIGAGIGSMLADCIIITACTSPDSYEVNIAREYRDNILDKTTLGGYYALCNVTVPLIHKSRLFKRFVKRFLVDRMIDYFEVALNYKNRTEWATSKPITKIFLSMCHLIGLRVNTKAWIALHT